MPSQNISLQVVAAANMPYQGLVNPGNDIDFEDTWDVISSALREMHTKNASKLSFETIYRHGYKVVLKKKGDEFYDRLQKFENTWLNDEVRSALKILLTPTLITNAPSTNAAATMNERRTAGERFLKGLKEAYEDHVIVMNMATDVFMYLVRSQFVLLTSVLTFPEQSFLLRQPQAANLHIRYAAVP